MIDNVRGKRNILCKLRQLRSIKFLALAFWITCKEFIPDTGYVLITHTLLETVIVTDTPHQTCWIDLFKFSPVFKNTWYFTVRNFEKIVGVLNYQKLCNFSLCISLHYCPIFRRMDNIGDWLMAYYTCILNRTFK